MPLDPVLSWDECVGGASWLKETLQDTLGYPTPLPVQSAVVPRVSRALLSGIATDVSLTAPTGSGKTLCYLLPILRLITEEKRGANETALRAIVLAPTRSLGQQVYHEVARLARPTTIRVASLCADDSAKSGTGASAGAADNTAAEADALVRRVFIGQNVGDEACVRSLSMTGGKSGLGESADAFRYFSKVDVLVATPQRLLHHLDCTPGLSLASLRLLVIDEADQVLSGNFASMVVKVVERFDDERRHISEQECRAQRQQQEQLQCGRGSGDCGTAAADRELLTGCEGRCSFTYAVDTAAAAGGRHADTGRPLHKVLCSATLSSRIARISEVRLRNCHYFALDTNGVDVPDTSAQASAAADAPGKVVTAVFALPPTLQEHVVFVENNYRHAVLLKLVRLLLRGPAVPPRNGSNDNNNSSSAAANEDGRDLTAAPLSYPDARDGAGDGVIVFCGSADEARVVGHFLDAAGVEGVVEFTTLATDSERRRALLQATAATAAARGSRAGPLRQVIVASDALMRGIDIPNTGHVIMYHPPGSVAQFIHRAGRTARAMRPGHLHILLSKLGPSGTQADGEVAAFKQLSLAVTRTLPVRYERRFFDFAAAPGKSVVHPATTAAVSTAAVATMPKRARSPESERGATAPATEEANDLAVSAPAKESAEWWVSEANKFLDLSQHQLQLRWSSVMEKDDSAAGSSAPQRVKKEV